MTTELVTLDPFKYAKALAESSFLDDAYRGHPENVFVVIETGKALGLPPIQAINSINIIKGKPAMSADLMASLVRRAGCILRTKQEGTGRAAVVTATLNRPDDKDYTFTATWNWQRAEQAGIVQGHKGIKTNWAAYPEQMLRARAVTEVCRMGASDFLMGVLYTPEELEDTNPPAIASVEISQEPQAQEPEPERMADSQIGAILDMKAAKEMPDELFSAGVAHVSGGRAADVEDLTVTEGRELYERIRNWNNPETEN